MPFKDPEVKRAYDRGYRRTHRDKANEAQTRYVHTTRGILKREHNRMSRWRPSEPED